MLMYSCLCWDPSRLTFLQLLDAIEPDLEAGGQIIDWHACDMFPLSLIDLVVVIRCDSTILFDRLKARGYSDKKLDENMDAEIMEVLLQEARDSYDEEIVVELHSNDLDQIDENLDRIQCWIENWKKDHS
jgi:adenylate kinase